MIKNTTNNVDKINIKIFFNFGNNSTLITSVLPIFTVEYFAPLFLFRRLL